MRLKLSMLSKAPSSRSNGGGAERGGRAAPQAAHLQRPQREAGNLPQRKPQLPPPQHPTSACASGALVPAAAAVPPQPSRLHDWPFPTGVGHLRQPFRRSAASMPSRRNMTLAWLTAQVTSSASSRANRATTDFFQSVAWIFCHTEESVTGFFLAKTHTNTTKRSRDGARDGGKGVSP